MTAAAPETPATPVYRPDQLLGARHDTPDMTGALVGFEPFGESAQESAAVTPGQAPRDLRAEEITREFTGWAEAQGYGDDELYSFAEMDETFAAGMEAERNLAARQPQPAPGGKRDPLSCPCCVFGGDDCWCRADCGVERCQARDLADDVQPAPELADPRPGEALAADNARLREQLAKILSWFTEEPVVSSRRYASATRAQLARSYRDGGLSVPEELRRFL